MSIDPAFPPPCDYAGRPPVLLVSSSDAGHARAAEPIMAAGFRISAVAMIEALDRLAIQASASALWIEVDDDGWPGLERLLDRARAEAASGRYPAIVSVPLTMIDAVAPWCCEEPVEILADASSADRLSALVTATFLDGAEPRLQDIASEPTAARLRQISDEVSRIATALARLSEGPASAPEVRLEPVVRTGEPPSISGDAVRHIIRSRRLRSRYFEEGLFADPAWDMLLDLLQAEIDQHRVPVSSLCIAAAVPPTTALRWIRTMTDAGLFQRRSDPSDGRRVFVELTPPASLAMRQYLAETGFLPTI